MNRGIGGLRYCMYCGRPGDHNTVDCPMRMPVTEQVKQRLREQELAKRLQKR